MAETEPIDAAAEATPAQETAAEKTVTEPAEDATAPQRSEQEERQRRRAQRQVQDAFAACVRCGYFLSDYRILHGPEHFADVVGTKGHGWLELTWALPLRALLEKSYGLRIDANVEEFKAACGACGRSFTLQRSLTDTSKDETESAAAAVKMRIQIRPRGRSDAA